MSADTGDPNILDVAVVTQLAAVLPKRTGALADLCHVLKRAQVETLAMCLLEADKVRLARFIPDDAEAARNALDVAGIPCGPGQVLLVSCANAVTAVEELSRALKTQPDYFYLGVPDGQTSRLVLAVPDVDQALAALR